MHIAHNIHLTRTQHECNMHEIYRTSYMQLRCKKIQPVHSEGDEPWDFFGRNDAEAEVIDISPGNLDSSLCLFQSSVSHDVLSI